MQRKSGFLALATSVVVFGALAAPAMAGEDELRTFNVDDIAVIGETGGGDNRGDRIAVEVEYDCRTIDEQSGRVQRFAVGVNLGQPGFEEDDPDSEASGVRARDCDSSSDEDRVIVVMDRNPGSADFDSDDNANVDAVGVTFLPSTNDFTDIDFDQDDDEDVDN
jgi:hypothetical protein